MKTTRRPVVGVISDMRDLGGMAYQIIGDKYVQAVSQFAGCLPIAVLSEQGRGGVEELLALCDGFLFTGSPSNIRPWRYGDTAAGDGPFDDARDALSLALIPAILRARVPALFICRGLQELNVAQGGTLQTKIPAREPAVEHHAPEDAGYEDRYAPLHRVSLIESSPLADVFGAPSFAVNSLHYQALAKIGGGLTVHGYAEDGIAEIVAADGHPFAVGVQWHPEYRPELSAPNRALFEHFGQAVRARRDA
ncbi:gamma-glutamyl-gamma-aminobutyrate hydrolase family protein [Acidocella sp.]|uniref:gamma-glutamyl-gamma-aminobutyrate hydrolase family protein n=1 Tax=Acidocella sp. TaxID=50710 RepID=UPI00261B3BBE|nr:gamma-glutamyl-gamma-aminobutyrate hydrolase family protein [Acidocella sp.]MDD2795416.1 gamma-glutamyl-gamma-aminobutyrate hydrolase family protein [Acidocella sp.]